MGVRRVVGWLVIALALGACGKAPQTSTVAVGGGPLAGHDCLILVLDALAADHLGSYGSKHATSPHIDALAEDGVRFDQAWSQTSWTLASTASLMTGLYQESHGVTQKTNRLGARDLTIAEAFTEAGYETLGFGQNPFASTAFGMDRGFDSFEDLYRDEGQRADAGLTDRVIASLASDAEKRRPRFVYAHYRRPHAPYDAPPEIAAEFTDPSYRGHITGSADDLLAHNSGARPIGLSDKRQLRGLYDAGIYAVDAEIGRLLDAIDLSRTLVIVLSDHGEAFGRHGAYGHNSQSFEPMVNIPLIVAHPDLARGRVVNQPVMSIDIFPTLAELFGFDTSGTLIQGHSFGPRLAVGASMPVAGDERRPVFTSSRDFGDARQMQAVLVGDLKLVRSGRRDFVFDLANDPREQRDIALNRPADTADLVALLEDWKHNQHAGAADAAEIAADIEAELRALGYMGGAPVEEQPAEPDDK